MASVKVEDILEHLSSEMRSALEDAVRRVIPQAQFDSYRLYREFRHAVARKCSTWERVPDRCVERD